MRSRSRRPKSTLTSDKWLEPAAWVEVRKLLVRRESKRTRECPARKFLSDHKAARRCNRFVAIVAPAPLHVRVNCRVGQTRSIRLDKLLRRPGRAPSFFYRNKMCT